MRSIIFPDEEERWLMLLNGADGPTTGPRTCIVTTFVLGSPKALEMAASSSTVRMVLLELWVRASKRLSLFVSSNHGSILSPVVAEYNCF